MVVLGWCDDCWRAGLKGGASALGAGTVAWALARPETRTVLTWIRYHLF